MASFRERLVRAFPIFSEMLSERDTPLVRSELVSGGVAGPIAVSAIKAGDQLVAVYESAATTAVLTSRTAEFVEGNTDKGWTVRNDGFIDNTGGTDTTGDSLLVFWIAWAE